MSDELEQEQQNTPPDEAYYFDLSVSEQKMGDVASVVLKFLDESQSTSGGIEVALKGNMTVADIERGLATALEALDTWWQREAHQFPEEVLGSRDLAFVNRIWTPFSEPEEQR